ncbi:uncharacterized protein [Drosophila tropicalis]|uniref:uncharacterized protein isoform X1 n=1 Tax=Drosophila tropicalis TaxID=46794 RepID=UPI0035ABCA5F
MSWSFHYGLRKVLLFTMLLVLLIFIYASRKAIHYEVYTKLAEVTKEPGTTGKYYSRQAFPSEVYTKLAEVTETPGPTGKFYVYTSKCKIPYVDPFTNDSIDQPIPLNSCANESDLFNVHFDTQSKRYIIHVDTQVALTIYSNYSDYGCTYQEIKRGANDSYSVLRAKNYFKQDWIVPQHFLGVLLECREYSKPFRVLQRDAFAFVQYPSDRDDKADAERSSTHPSVLLFGIDSMSRINFQRTMPKSAEFVTQPGWYEMQGYNKVGDNTLPNLLAILTGRTQRQWRDTCDVRKPGCFDYIDYWWNHFSDAGYLTAYAEDLASISTFNYLKYGFQKQPVNYYLRPFLVVIENALQTMRYYHSVYCVGRRYSFSYVFDFAHQLIQRFIHETPKPIFGLFWTSSFTHEDYRGGYNLDSHFVDYLTRFQELGLFDKAIVILLSDHGRRFGPLTELSSGYIEERSPMLHIHLPEWYRKKYPNIANALQQNRQRLCSNFDLYLGIRQVLQQARPRIHYYSPTQCPECRSIFRKLPKSRSCQEAGIPEHYCTCDPYIVIPPRGFLIYLTRLLVNRMNKHLQRMGHENDCYRLRLKGIYQIEQKQYFNKSGHPIYSPKGYNTYRVKFSTKPNSGLFRATFMCNNDIDIVNMRVDRITRLNSYRDESYCVQEAQSRKFCLCLKNKKQKPVKTEITLLTDESDYDELDD